MRSCIARVVDVFVALGVPLTFWNPREILLVFQDLFLFQDISSQFRALRVFIQFLPQMNNGDVLWLKFSGKFCFLII